jgi:ribonuclease BN (tRNA processing enzyme)
VDLTVLGAGPAYTDRRGSLGAAYLLRSGTTSVVLDLGQGSFPELASRIEPSTIDALFMSHLHPDHFIDLVPLRHYLRYEFQPPRRVTVHGPSGLDERLDALHAEPGFSAAALDVRPLGNAPTAVGALTVEPRLVTHTNESYAFRVSDVEGAAIVYSGDCGRATDLDALIRPGDTLLVEASFGPGPVAPGAQHLDGPAVGALAARTRPSLVLVTHVQMGYDPAETVSSVQASWDGPVRLVIPGDHFAIGEI